MAQLQEAPTALKIIPEHFMGRRGLNGLIDHDKKDETQRTPSTLEEIQTTLAKGMFAQLPEQLVERLGIEKVTLIKWVTLILHPCFT